MAAFAGVTRPPGLVLSPDDGAALAARAVVRFHRRVVAAVEQAACAGEVEPVHQLRVATRRLRAALRLFAPLLPARLTEAAERDLAWLASAIGEVRDLDVLAAAVHARAVRLDPELRRTLGPLGIAMHDRRAAALEALTGALDSSRCRRLFDRLTAFAESPPPPRRNERLGEVAGDLVRPLLRAVTRVGRRLGPDSPATEFHRLRVRVKRLRYALETLRGLGGKPVRRLLVRLEALQDVLGEAQDAQTQIAWLHAYAGTAEAPAGSLLAVGALIQALSKRAVKRRRRALKAWRKLEQARLVEAAAASLGREARARRTALREAG